MVNPADFWTVSLLPLSRYSATSVSRLRPLTSMNPKRANPENYKAAAVAFSHGHDSVMRAVDNGNEGWVKSALDKQWSPWGGPLTKQQFLEKCQKHTKNLNDAINKHGIEPDGSLWRGLRLNSKQALHELLGSDPFVAPAFSSTSRKFDVARSFGSGGSYGVVVEYRGVKKALPIEHVSKYKHEAELIIPKGPGYQISGISVLAGTGGKMVHVIVEPVEWEEE